MAQENKQAKTFSVDGLKKLLALTSNNGDFANYKGEIINAQKKVDDVLSNYRRAYADIKREEDNASRTAEENSVNEQPSVAAPTIPVETEVAPKTTIPVNSTAVQQKSTAQPKPAAPQNPSQPKTNSAPKAPAASAVIRTKQFSTPSYVKGVVDLSLRQDRPKKPAAKTQQGSRPPYGDRPAYGSKPPYGDRPAFPRSNNTSGGPRPSSEGRFSAPAVAPITGTKPVRKVIDKKKEVAKPFDDKKSMTKRTLIRKGFISDDIDDDRIRVRRLKNKKKVDQVAVEPKSIDNVTITNMQVTIRQLSELISVPAQEIMKKILLMGGTPIKSINDVVDFDTLYLVADSFGVTLNQKIEQTQEEVAEALHIEADDEKDLLPRPPVITVMGHVDHGKTSLLDAIRKTNVVSGEAGGITQHIGAYSVSWEYEKKKRAITFLDTPGHEAFTEMRARGTKVTDIVILVVAADDGVMPQTIEAINHVKAAKVPMIVAINKIDKPGANVDHIKEELSAHGVITDEWGGDIKMVPISAKKNIGIDTLLEEILFLADVNDYRANPNRKAKGAIIEARLDKGKGPVASILVQNGTLNRGDAVVCGTTYGKIRSMTDALGKMVKTAGPSTAVSVTGLSDVPNAGDDMWVVDDEKTAKAIADGRVEKDKESHAGDMATKTFDVSGLKTLNVIIKADVQGSAEALKSSIAKLINEEVQVSVVHCGVGTINKSDMMLAEVTHAFVIGFNVKPDSEARLIAEHSKISVGSYNVIYDAINAIEAEMTGMIAPKYHDVYLGKAQVRAIFKISDVGVVAGSYVLDGKIQRNSKGVVKRGDKVIYEGTLSGLKRFKDDAKEVAAGFECGISFDNFNELLVDDEIESYITERIK